MMEEDIEIEGNVLNETSKAWCISCHAGDVWLPKSQCERVHIDGVPQDTFYVPTWLAEEKELI